MSLHVSEAFEQIEDFFSLIPVRLHDCIRNITLAPSVVDRLISVLSNSGQFSTGEFWHHFRVSHPKLAWGAKIWQP